MNPGSAGRASGPAAGQPLTTPPASTLQVGTIQGGAALNIVPAVLPLILRSALLPGMRPEAVTEALAAYRPHRQLPEMRRVGGRATSSSSC
ncbi:peptidase dimerization domain-containing protein [Klebsiella pneumoniae]|nr:peptidase dimerization domain-containing protein [Klebsiella pneumoniae]